MNVMVTGGSGFIGSHLCRNLVKQGEKVFVFDSFRQGEWELIRKVRMSDYADKVEVINGDITDFPFVLETLKKNSISRIIHTAAITFIPTAIKKPSLTFKVNTVGSFNLLEAARILDLKKFVYISSASTYGDFQYSPVDEGHPLEPKDIYGATKAAADRLSLSYFRTYGLPVSVVRTSSVYGSGDLEGRIVKVFIERALTGQVLRLEHGGTQVRDFSYVKDVSRGIELVFNSKKADGEVFNITGNDVRSIKEVAEIIKKLVPGTRMVAVPGRKVDVKRGRLDLSKAKKVLGYEPKYNLERGIKEYIKWFREVYVPIYGLNIVR